MPIYQYQCRCGEIIEKFHKITRIPNTARCKCGWLAKKIISVHRVQADSINDVKWLPSALQTLQRPGEKPIESRSEYNAYLKKKDIACVG
jgi:putative FmdB family regulatory protein